MRPKIAKLQCRTDLTFDYLIDHFSYDPDSGRFWRIKRYDSWGKRVDCNNAITSKNNRGYFWTNIGRRMFLVHRLIYLFMTGQHPTHEIDHINGDRLDNRWVNLRHVTPFENARNQGNRVDNTSGCRGVTLNINSNKWVARISHEGIRYSLGYFRTKEEAIEARKKAERELKYHENHGVRESWRR